MIRLLSPIIRNKKWKMLRCKRCGTVFIARLEECSDGDHYYAIRNWMVNCPTCSNSVFYGRVKQGDYRFLERRHFETTQIHDS